MSASLVILLFVAQPKPGTFPPNAGTPKAMTEEQKCQQDCSKKILECQMPCMPKDQAEADKPEVRKKFMSCATDCAKKQKPCLDSCGTKGKKKKDGDKSEKPEGE